MKGHRTSFPATPAVGVYVAISLRTDDLLTLDDEQRNAVLTGLGRVMAVEAESERKREEIARAAIAKAEASS